MKSADATPDRGDKIVAAIAVDIAHAYLVEAEGISRILASVGLE